MKKNKGVVDFTNFIYILSIISKGTPQELLQCILCFFLILINNNLDCFDLYDTDNDKLIGKEEFEKILNTFKKYYYFEFFFNNFLVVLKKIKKKLINITQRY